MTKRRVLALLLSMVLGAAGCKTEGDTPTPGQASQPETPSASTPTITLDPSTVYQTVSGWQMPVGTPVNYPPQAQAVLGKLLELGVTEVGVNRVTLDLFPGVERPSPDCQLGFMNGSISERDFADQCAYNPVNDNSDPNVAAPNGFHFVLTDWQIDNIVLPMRRLLQSRGESLYLSVRFVDFKESAFEPNQNPAEYAELVLALFEHIRSKYGFVPDGFDVINEPDNSPGWRDPSMIGRLAATAGQRLARAGFQPDLTAPSTMNKGNAPSYFDGVMAQAGASQYVKELGWHCYADSGQNSSAQIAARGLAANVRTVQSECWTQGNNYQQLHDELKNSRNAVWGMGLINGPNGYYAVGADGSITLRDRPKYMRQYFRHIRSGARRIGATSSAGTVDPVAFVNQDGRYVVVVKAQAASPITLTNLPAGTYGIYSTTGPDPSRVSAFDIVAPDQTVGPSGRLSTNIQGSGVITIYRKPASNSDIASGSSAEADQMADATREMLPFRATYPESTYLTRDGQKFSLRWVPGSARDAVAIAATPDLRTLVATKTRIDVLREGTILPVPALTLPPDAEDGPEVLQAVAVDRRFAANHFVYTLSSLSDAGKAGFRVSRYVEAGDRLFNRVVLLEGIPASATPSGALAVGLDGTLYVAFDQGLGDSWTDSPGSYNGKVLRLNPDGTTPRDNKLGSPLFAAGYRFPCGIGWDEDSGAVWVAGHDESAFLDVLGPGADGPGTRLARFLLPADVTPSGLSVYHSNRAPLLKNNVLVASPRTGELLRLTHSTNLPEAPVSERLLSGDVGAIHALGVSTDGLIYFGSDRGIGILVPESLAPGAVDD